MKDWESALRVVDQEIALAPEDMDLRAWRARVLQWSGNLAQAEKEYLQVLQVSKNDPDNWLGLAEVYLREGKANEALRAFDVAVGLDPARAHLRMAHCRALAAAGDRQAAQGEFQQALKLDPANKEARTAQKSAIAQPGNELRFGQEDNVFNFTGPNYDEWVSLRTQWSIHWATTFLGNFFQCGPADAGKLGASVTGRLAKWGALTGTEDFASVDQIGSFASQTFGGGLRLSITTRQDIGPYVSYQKRSGARTDTNFGLNYGLRF